LKIVSTSMSCFKSLFPDEEVQELRQGPGCISSFRYRSYDSTNQQWNRLGKKWFMSNEEHRFNIEFSNLFEQLFGWVPFTRYSDVHTRRVDERLHDGSCFASAFQRTARMILICVLGAEEMYQRMQLACVRDRLAGARYHRSGNERSIAMSEEIDQHTVLSMCWMPRMYTERAADGPVTLLLNYIVGFLYKGF